jgi:hypothetical protein
MSVMKLGDKNTFPKKVVGPAGPARADSQKVTCGFGPYETLTNSWIEFLVLLLTRFMEE